MREGQLLEEGWCRRFCVAGEWLKFGVEAFAEMGHEVSLLDVVDDVSVAKGDMNVVVIAVLAMIVV